jgi:hypothetical protein
MEEQAGLSCWLNTFSRSALGLVDKAKPVIKGTDISVGIHKLIELEVLEHYSRKTREVWFSPVGRFKSFDGISQSKSHSVEVKFEAQAAKTHNLCIEYSYKGQPSGLAVTMAARWVHVVPVDHERFCCFEFDVEKLREALKPMPFLCGGDFMRSRIRLLPVSKAEELKSAKFFISIDWKQLAPYW